MGDTETIIFRMDAKLKRRCEALYEELGFSLEEAAVLFFEKSVEAEGFPLGVCPEYLQQHRELRKGKKRRANRKGPCLIRKKADSKDDPDDTELIDAFYDMKESMH